MKICKSCGSLFDGTGYTKICDKCRLEKYTCPKCGGFKKLGNVNCGKCDINRVCKKCGKPFISSGVKIYCSKECKIKSCSKVKKRKKTIKIKECMLCGCSFSYEHGSQKKCESCISKINTCPSCGGKKSADHKHCKKCMKFSHTYKCKSCGKECIGMSGTFYCKSCFPACIICGKKVRTVHNGCCSISCATKLKWKSPETKEKLQAHIGDLLAGKYNKGSKGSKAEKIREDWFLGNNISYEKQFQIENSFYDFKIGKYLIEVNPTATHNSTKGFRDLVQPFKRNGHQKRSLLGEEYGYQVIHLFDWDNNDKVKNWLLGLLKGRKRLYASTIKELSPKDAALFYDENHLQGSVGASIHYGLFKGNQLVNAMSFTLRGGEWYLERFASLSGFYVAHGAEKLFNHFVKEHNPNTVISYSDITKHSGLLYKSLGFNTESITEPSYRWVHGMHSGSIPYWRRRCQKKHMHTLPGFNNKYKYEENKNDDFRKQTETQLMESHGYYILYDSGNRRHVWRKK